MKHLVMGLLLAVGACSKGGVDGKLDELSKIKDKMCDCKDKKCADDTHEEYIAWKKGNKDEKKPDKDQMERYEQIKAGMNACKAKARGELDGAGTPPAATPPAAEGSAK